VSPLLEISDLHVRYNAVPAVNGVSIVIGAGEIRLILGANGAGKSTIIKAILGLQPAASGSIRFNGEHDLLRLRPHQIHRLGISWVPEGRQLWGTLTVLENLRMGGFIERDAAKLQRRIDELLERFPRLGERRNQLAGSLSGGEQQMVAIGRALMARPRLICMDEPSMGLSPLFVEQVFDIIQAINKQGTTIFMVEQNAAMALSIAHRAYVVQTGQVVLSGPASELRENEMIRSAYLGELTVPSPA
jgi:branched-chain amino acid transport system ATP-binding protein